MRKLVPIAATLVALLWPAAAWAVVTSTEVTITENGKPVDGATITLSTPQPPPTQTASRPKRTPTATRTDSAGQTTVTYDDEDARAGWLVDITVRRRDGSTRTVYGVPLSSIGSGRPIDIAGGGPVPATAGFLPGYFWGVDIGAGFLRGIKDPPVNNETLRSKGSGIVFGAHFGMCALAVLACLEANIRNGESGKSQEVAGFQLRTRKAMVLALALGMPFPVGDTFYVRPFVGLGYGRFTSEVGNFRATDWMPMWHVGLAFGTMVQTVFGPALLEGYWRFDDTFGRQDVTLGRIDHSNQFVGFRVSFPFGNAAMR